MSKLPDRVGQNRVRRLDLGEDALGGLHEGGGGTGTVRRRRSPRGE